MRSGGFRREAWQQVLVACAMLALTLPFVGKPPHIDEESYLFIGREIQDTLLRPYDWWRPWQPFESGDDSFVYAHPPLFLWTMAGLVRLWGEHATEAMRLSMAPLTVLLAVLFFRIAGRLTRHRWWATLGFIASPAMLLTCHQSLMIDLPFVVLSLAAALLMFDANRLDSTGRAWLAGAVLGAACLTKYPALALLPLAFVGSRPRAGTVLFSRQGWRIACTAGLIIAGWEVWTWHSYGTFHLLYVLERAGEIERTPLFSRLVGDLAQLGWSVFAPPLAALFLAVKARRKARIAVAGIVLGLLAPVLLVTRAGVDPVAGPPDRLWYADDLSSLVPNDPALLFLLMVALGLGLLALSGFRLRSREDRFLAVWAILAVGVAVVAHNFASARYLAPAAAPLHLLLWRRLEESGGWLEDRRVLVTGVLALGAALGLGVAQADWALASVYPPLGERVATRVEVLSDPTAKVWFTGEWGFRHEMERRGYQYLYPGASVRPGDLVVVPETACPGDLSEVPELVELQQLSSPKGVLRTMAPGRGVGFYSEAFGLLPWGPAPGVLERVTLFRVK